jgi:hypothetical protein
LNAFGIPLSGIRIWGKLTPNQVAELLGRTDMFLDLSEWQAMGLTTLEAMASGAVVIVPRNGGTKEFCIDGESGIVLDESDEEAYFNAASALIRDSHTRFGLGKKAMEVASALSPEVAAYKFLNCFWNEAPSPFKQRGRGYNRRLWQQIAPRFRRVGRLSAKATRPGCRSRVRRASAKPACYSVA